MKLDRFDIKILEALQEDGRLPTARLAERIGLSASPTWERVKRLEEAGILRGYHADIAADRLPQLTQVLVTVTLESHRAQDFKRFETAVAKASHIVACWAVGGDIDYVLMFAVADVSSYQQAVDETLTADLAVRQYWSYIVTKPIKPFAGLPIGHLLGSVED
ncbi:Lrp/AsnC family transcriptional regulator [Steroidobacter sp.]|uniref:Lrp/AsnC family transcriptional regulator n=1 Tax=Steroidobacter sp. TaxID=1978227 RepID=UPI001A5B66B8|nr:Lrp/AsnC family transcriptional regulator [Steroidobacter sp.]MBL8267997.1 Lrp/AsnC family transcriptional regulator [Steroidobacter sp.]